MKLVLDKSIIEITADADKNLMILVLDGSKINSDMDFHRIIAKVFDLPYYGHNCNALADFLEYGGLWRPLHIIWLNSERSKKMIERFNNIITIFERCRIQDIEFGTNEKLTYELL